MGPIHTGNNNSKNTESNRLPYMTNPITENPLSISTYTDAIIRETQTIYSEIEKNRLLEKLMRVIIENSGSNRGYILTTNEKHWFLDAYEMTNTLFKTIIDNQPVIWDSPEVKDILPISIINLVKKNKQPLIIGDIPASRFSSDIHYDKNSIASAMSFPIMLRNELKGIIYLENDYLKEAYNQQRLELLTLFAAHAAISLENSILYANLGKQIEKRTAELESANHTIREREERLRLVLDGITDGFWDWNLEINEIYRSDRWFDILGYSPNEVDPNLLTWEKVVHPDDVQAAIRALNDCLDGKIPKYEAEYRMITKSGELKWVIARGRVVSRNEKGKPLRMTGTCSDITDHKIAEIKLMEEHNFNVALLKTAGTLIAVCDQQGRIVLFNQKCEQITGYKSSEVIGRYIGEIVYSPEDDGMITELFNKHEHFWETYDVKEKYEDRWLAKDGKYHLISLTITCLFNEPGHNFHLICTGIDITEHRAIEERLNASEVKLRSIYENVNGIIFTLSTEGILSFVSHAWTRLLGHDIADVEGSPWTLFVHPDDVPICIRYFETVWFTGEARKGVEYRAKHKNGTWHWFACNGAVVRDNEGNSLYIVGISDDITDRKQAEAEITYLSYHDKLTGLYNRSFFEEELKRVNTTRQLPLGLIIGDVNGLKLVNDALGHLEGDKVLIQAAEIFKKACRHEDIISRWGGDEFIVLLPRCDRESTLKVFKRISDSFISVDSLPILINISLGMAIRENIERDIREVIREAEEKMYRNKLLQSKSNRSSFINSLEKTLWERSHETEQHCQRMHDVAEKIGRILGLTDSEIDSLKLLSMLHDIGKIAIPNSILDKPGELSPEEWEIIKSHPETGYRIALSSPELAPIAEAILHHHEWWNGNGYPLGIKGDNIPLLSRIVAIIDAYDVMTNGRPYKKPMTRIKALFEIERCAGTQFDPKLVDQNMLRLLSLM